jgi:hypothetical protein
LASNGLHIRDVNVVSKYEREIRMTYSMSAREDQTEIYKINERKHNTDNNPTCVVGQANHRRIVDRNQIGEVVRKLHWTSQAILVSANDSQSNMSDVLRSK